MRPPYSSTADAVDDDDLRLVPASAGDGRATSPCCQRHRQPRTGSGPGVDAIVAQRHPGRRRRRRRPAARRRRRPVADRRRPRPAHPRAAGAGLPVHHRPEARVGLPADHRPASPRGPAVPGTRCARPRSRRRPASSSDALTWLLRRRRACSSCSGWLLHARRRRPAPAPAAPARLLVGAAGHRAGVGDRARLQREARTSRRPCARWSASDHPSRGHRRRRRLHRRHRRHRRGAAACPSVRVIRQANGGKPAALNTGIAHARHELIVMIDGDTVFEPDTVGRLVQPFADPTVGAVAGNAKVANRRGLIGALAAHRVRDGLQPRPPHVRRRCAACRPSRARSARSAARRCSRSAGVSDDTLAEDTDLTMAICRRRLAGGLRGARPRLDRGAGDAGPAVAPALPLELRDDAGDVEAPPRGARAGRVRPLRPARACRYLALFQVLLPLLAPLVDIFLVYGLIFLDPATTLVAWWRGARASSSSPRRTRSGSTASRCGRCGCCRCSRSSTAS